MTWQEGVAVALVCVGLVAGAYIAAQRPAFWLELGTRLLVAVAPKIWVYLSKRMPPEEEAAWRAAERAGRGDEWLRERWRRNRRKAG